MPHATRGVARTRRGLVACTLLLAIAISCSDDGPEPTSSEPTVPAPASTTTSTTEPPRPAVGDPFEGDAAVTVDLTAPRSQRSRYGVLHWNAVMDVPAEFVEPLQPTLLRTPLIPDQLDAQLERFETVNILFSDSYGYPPNWPAPPYVDSEAWRDTVRSVLANPTVVATMAESPERLVFEPWNEPDIPLFWDGTLDQYTEVWLETEALVREVYPDARIGGPSHAFYDTDAIVRFLDRCAAADCRLDHLIWHGFQVDLPSLRHDIEESLGFVTDRAYADLGLRGLLINEYPLATLDLLPAENLAFLEAFEDGDVFAGARACWGGTHVLADALDPSTWTNCGADNLNGFLTPAPELAPRAVWWVYERFAAGLDGRIETTTNDPAHEVRVIEVSRVDC